MQKIKVIRPIGSGQRNNRVVSLRTDGRTDRRGESDKPPKFSIEKLPGGKNYECLLMLGVGTGKVREQYYQRGSIYHLGN